MTPASSPTETTEEGQLLTAQDVADILGVSKRTVWRMVSAGEIRRFRIGHRTVRYWSGDIELMVERSRVPPTRRASHG